jgi:CheY-like chemotaxis protein
MIEDDPAIADMYRVQLEHDGYSVSVAATAEVALNALSGVARHRAPRPAAARRSGFEMLAALNERFRAIRPWSSSPTMESRR